MLLFFFSPFFICVLNIQHVIEKGKGAACLLPDLGMIKGRSFSDITDRKGIVKAALKKESLHKEPVLKPLLKASCLLKPVKRQEISE